MSCASEKEGTGASETIALRMGKHKDPDFQAIEGNASRKRDRKVEKPSPDTTGDLGLPLQVSVRCDQGIHEHTACNVFQARRATTGKASLEQDDDKQRRIKHAR